MQMQVVRDHMFISYASEQSALCDWLSRKLASAGYAVWYDRLKLLGGEDWPDDIDKAIDLRTFRMLALLSRSSMSKTNPQGEWMKGRAIGNKLGIKDFVIPLNTEGLRPEEIKWNLQTINYIPFAPSWAEGFAALLKKLESIDAPRVLQNGPQLAKESLANVQCVIEGPEILLSNCFEILQVPRFVCTYDVNAIPLAANVRRRIQRKWACWFVSGSRVLSFHEPPPEVCDNQRFRFVKKDDWRNTSTISGISARDLIVNLVHRCVHRLMASTRLQYSEVSRQWFVPSGLLPNDSLKVRYPGQRPRRFKAVGKRKYRSSNSTETYRYHLSPSFALLRNHDDPYVLFLRNRVYLTDSKGNPLEGRRLQSRRKHLCKTWFNREWCNRTLGIVQLLSGSDGHLRFGPEGGQQLIISATPVELNSPLSILDEFGDSPDETYSTWSEGYVVSPSSFEQLK